MSKHAKLQKFETFDDSVPRLWNLLPPELVTKIALNFDSYSQLCVFRSLCKQTMDTTTPLHERCIRLRDQMQHCCNTKHAAVFPNPMSKTVTCTCGFVNNLPIQLEISSFQCSNWLCRKVLLPTLSPPIIEIKPPNKLPEKAGAIQATSNLEQNKFRKGDLVSYRWRSRKPNESTYSTWSCMKRLSPFSLVRTTDLDPELLYCMCIRVETDVGVSAWSEPSVEVHPLTEEEVRVIQGKETGYFAR